MRQKEQKCGRRLTQAQRRRKRMMRHVRRELGTLAVLMLVLVVMLFVWKMLVTYSKTESYSAGGLTTVDEISESSAENLSDTAAFDSGESALTVETTVMVQNTVVLKEPEMIVPMTEVYVAASTNHSAWVLEGQVHVAGSESYDQNSVDGWQRIVQLSLSDGHIAAVNEEGRVLAAGQNGSGQCNANDLQDVAYVAAGLECTVCVMRDGTVRVYGSMDGQMRTGLEAETNVLLLDVGVSHAVVLHMDGTVSAYGANTNGECDVENWQGVKSVSVGAGFTVALTEDGDVLFCGNNSYNQKNAVQWTDMAAVEAGSSFIVGVREDGTMCATGRNGQGQCDLDLWQKVVAVAAGYDHTIGLTADGEVVAAGYNGDGQCEVH